jgi:hypothetical protein
MLRTVFFVLYLLGVGEAAAQDRLQPYLLFPAQADSLAAQVEITRKALQAGGFTLLGEYAPYDTAHVLAVTHPSLLSAAADTALGGYGAALRVSVTAVGDTLQLAAANPPYWGQALHIGDLTPAANALVAALGDAEGFGAKRGLTPKELANYRYMLMMPRLRDHDVLAHFDSHQDAVAAVRAGIATGTGVTPVFEVAVPGTEQVLFGVGLKEGAGADATVMATTDRGERRHTPHLPYAVLVSGGHVVALAGKFRIALAFPDLGMGTFMKISGAPDAIRDTLQSLVQPPG